ncbi:MAG: helix-turn-helix domain-containing protein [Deltaproteobacteria bacterium]|jgi:putative zinc finger/helix-turn-helix YgiT family protein|nr:MAG: helix-turn-helix domain-containing protein [Deltaproteobacteria bacterium]
MKSVKRKCSRCGNTGLDEKKRPATRTVAGHSFKASVPALVCDSCGAIYFNGPALENFDLAVANKLARAGVSDGEAVKFIRKAVGLPAVTLAELLDTSPETVSRWERGVSRIDRAAFAILAGIVMEKADDRSDTLERLRALRHPARLGQLVQIEA